MKTNNQRVILFIGNFLSASISTRGMGEELVGKLVERNWEIMTISSYLNRFRRILDMIVTILKNHRMIQFANIEIYSGLAFLWAEISVYLLSRCNKKIIVTLHGGKLPEFAKRWPGRVRRMLDTSTIITTPSLYLQKSLNYLSPNILYLPNGLEIENYLYQERKELTPRLVWLRAFHQIYNPLLAVQVIEQLKSKFQDVHLLMIGPDKKDGSFDLVKREIENKGLEKNIEIIGEIPKSEVPKYLNRADIFINTTNYESFGVAVMEAGAVGLPIVSTKVGELPYLWQNEKNAILVEAKAENFGKAIERILVDPVLAQKLSINARKNAELYDWGNILFQWESIFEKLILEDI